MMLSARFQDSETIFFRGLNYFVEPLVRAGLWAPMLIPAGPIVVGTRGRKSGRPLKVPLMAALVGDLAVVSTVRRQSNWLKNLAANPEVHYWLAGRERDALAFAIGPDLSTRREPPARVRCLAAFLKQHSELFGTGFAILIPRETSNK